MPAPTGDHAERTVFIRNNPNNEEEQRSNPEGSDHIPGGHKNDREEDDRADPRSL